ncbi:hypothetical protein [Virgibacillus proomii]|jgi:hypothetical protein|uniref:hypothetical protein n=1 Tax=Virgibacillus proomii TaxID=84407 RepID=UPI0009855AEC|nr:hypothetical protein [Virgibacillus proomii]
MHKNKGRLIAFMDRLSKCKKEEGKRSLYSRQIIKNSRAELADIEMGSSFDCIMLNKGPYIAEAVDFLNETLRFIVKTHAYNQTIVRKQGMQNEYF